MQKSSGVDKGMPQWATPRFAFMSFGSQLFSLSLWSHLE